jgi:hypothetical protein
MTNIQSQHPHVTMKMTQQGTHAQNPDMNHVQKANSFVLANYKLKEA